MNDLTDQQLLRQYSGQRSEAAFAELVRRRIDLVYSAALRMVRDAHLAEDITQGVFVALAQNAPQLTARPVLSGWLHRTAQNLATKAIRTDARRRAREQEAATMNELLSAEPETAWEHLAPHLDAALGELHDTDRDALLLRYFENKNLREVGQQLGLTDDAAQKRVSRAVERLREFFAKRGVTVGASGLVVALTTNAVQAAPVNLAVTISAAAIAGTAVSTSTTISATANAITMTAIQKTLITATVAVLAGAGIYQARQTSQLRDQVQTLRQQQLPMAEQIQRLQRERDNATNRLAFLADKVARHEKDDLELLRLRGMAGVARRAIGEVEQLRTELARARETGSSPVTGAMATASKQVLEQRAEDRLSRMTTSLHLTPEQARAAREILMRQAQARSAAMQQAFSGKYDKEELARLRKEAGDPEEQIKALLTSDQQAVFQNYQQEEAARNASQAANTELQQMESSLGLTAAQLDGVYAALYQVSFAQAPGSTTPSTGDLAGGVEAMQWAADQKARALEPILTPTQLDKYRQQQANRVTLLKELLRKMEGSAGPN